MSIVRARTVLMAMGVIAAASTMPGCDTLVSRDQYLNTAFGPAPARVSYHVGPSVTPESPKVIVIPGEAPASTGAAASGGAASGVVRGAQALTAEQQRFTTSATNQIAEMTARMAEIVASANVKGAAGNAALEPHKRAFSQTVEAIQGKIDGARSVPADAWGGFQIEIEGLLKQAQQAVDAAARDVEAVPTDK